MIRLSMHVASKYALLHRWLALTVIVVVAALAASMQLYATARFGPGLAPDSAAYVNGARALASSHEYTQLWPFLPPQPVPITKYPPGYSALLACGELLNMDAVPFSRWVNAALLTASVLLAAALTWQTTRSAVAAVLSAILIAFATDVLEVYTFTLSEPLFIVLLLVCLWSLATALDRSSTMWLITAAIAAAAAAMTRYIGLILPPLGAGLILLWSTRPLRRRVIDAGIYGAISAVPNIVWMIRNRRTGGSAASRALEWHPVTWQHIQSMCRTWTQWMLPVAVDRLWWIAPLLIVIACVALLNTRLVPRSEKSSGWSIARIMLAFILSYIPALMLSISFVDAATPMDSRLLSPLLIPMIVLGAYTLCAAGRVTEQSAWSWLLRSAIGAIAVGMMATDLSRTPAWLHNQYLAGDRLDYAARRWHISRTMQSLRVLSHDVPIWTNAPDATYLRLGRADYLIPWKETADGAGERADYHLAIESIHNAILDHGGAVAYFNGVLRRHQPTLADLRIALPDIEQIDFPNDGVIFADPATADRLHTAAGTATQPVPKKRKPRPTSKHIIALDTPAAPR